MSGTDGLAALHLAPGTPLLVRSPNWVGDAVMALPFYDALRHAFPGCPVTVVARPHAADIARLDPAVEVLVHDDRGLGAATLGRLAAARRLRERCFGAAFLLPNSLSSALLPFLARIPVRVGYSKDARGLLLTHRLPWDARARSLHRVQVYLDLLSRLGLPVPADSTSRRVTSDAERFEAEAVLARAGVAPDTRLAAIAPGAVGVSRRWPAERFGDTARALAAALGARVLVLGGPADRPLAAAAAARAGACAIDLAGAAPLALLPALLDRCDVLVSNDSGAAHVASLTATPTLVLFGAGNEAITRPMGPNIHILRTTLDCTPCEKNSCARGDLACLTALDAGAVSALAIRIARQVAAATSNT
ncbi:MAG: lipopolysaccharide heptosyltransferase II [Candidatus Wallbacteria bacterium]|nr:lipopolysaccharide heptosyltransferase II [Candidatus Wallbacteria bacterium]